MILIEFVLDANLQGGFPQQATDRRICRADLGPTKEELGPRR